MTSPKEQPAEKVGHTETYVIKRGYSAGHFYVGRVVKQTDKTVTVNEIDWNNRLVVSERRWNVGDVLTRVPTAEEALARVKEAEKAFKSHAAMVSEGYALLKTAQKNQADAARAAITKTEQPHV